MVITCRREDVQQSLQTVSIAVSRGAAVVPALSCVLIQIDTPGSGCSMTATNLSTTVRCWFNAETTTGNGAIAVPARLLAQLVSYLPHDEVVMRIDTASWKMRIESGQYETEIFGMNPDEFPTVPAAARHAHHVTLPAADWRRAVKQVAFAAADDMARPLLGGILVRIRDQRMTLAATDGYRLAVRRLHLGSNESPDLEFVVKARTMIDLARIDDGSHDMTITCEDGRHALFQTPTTLLWASMIDGSFPDFESILATSQSQASRVIVSREELAHTTRLAAVFAHASQNTMTVDVQADGTGGAGRVTITSNAPEIGGYTGVINASRMEGPGGTVALNASFVDDALNAMSDSSQVAIVFGSERNPVLLMPVNDDAAIGDDSSQHVIMPMHIRP